ncbi:hypothetical protein [Pontiella agarivorans]|uniref:Phosphate-selective porin O and P n=1 Tax=Pontiella agarivorans TaxID=3038953 RepID=A0ABU5MVD4_9BACT|nr:hypothetical protein [Pontiella agarivorans]MDZ8118189.1 hypothetical protein [Pontiella agarivorans]
MRFSATGYTKSITAFIFMGAFSASAGIPVGEVVDDVTGVDIGTLSVGGAIRANYVYGSSYGDSAGPSRGDHGGDMELDVFRINVDWQKDDWLGKLEYRWYNGYNMIHTGWLGYNLGEAAQLQVGINRAPFGVGPYGASQSWFFDMNYYAGLSDDMDLGIKYSRTLGDLRFDLAYYLMPEPNGNGATDDSARYSYDILDTVDSDAPGNPTAAHGTYKERNQFNGRVMYSILSNSIPTEVGVSLQVGQLAANNASAAEDTWAYAAAVHSSTTYGAWKLMMQLTHYDYGADFNDPSASDDLITMGAYDYAAPVASSGTIPSATLGYTWTVGRYDWIDSITLFGEASAILKKGEDDAGDGLNDSYMNSIGAVIATGGWYTYIEYAHANGNYFIGPDGDFGANTSDKWEGRFNINLGYYF